MTPTDIELASEQILDAWPHEITELTDTHAALGEILWSDGRERDEAITKWRGIYRAEAERIAKMNAETDPVFTADFARDAGGNIVDV